MKLDSLLRAMGTMEDVRARNDMIGFHSHLPSGWMRKSWDSLLQRERLQEKYPLGAESSRVATLVTGNPSPGGSDVTRDRGCF
jgi:hypothetical protein